MCGGKRLCRLLHLYHLYQAFFSESGEAWAAQEVRSNQALLIVYRVESHFASRDGKQGRAVAKSFASEASPIKQQERRKLAPPRSGELTASLRQVDASLASYQTHNRVVENGKQMGSVAHVQLRVIFAHSHS